MLTNGAVFPFHGACSIAFILANCQNTIKEAKEPETHVPALYQAILCTVEFSTVLKNCEFASAKSWRFCLQRDVPYFRTLSLPQPAFCQNGSSHMPFLLVNIWFQLFILQASNHLHGIWIPVWWKTGRFGAESTLSSAHPAPGHSCPETVCLKVVQVGRFAHSQLLLSQKLLQHLNAMPVWGVLAKMFSFRKEQCS